MLRSRENESEPEPIWGREKPQLERGRRKWNSRRGFGRVVLVGRFRVMGLMSKNGNIGPVIFYITPVISATLSEGERERDEDLFGGTVAICSYDYGGVFGCGTDHTKQSSHVQRNESLCLCCLLKCSCHSHSPSFFFHNPQVLNSIFIFMSQILNPIFWNWSCVFL